MNSMVKAKCAYTKCSTPTREKSIYCSDKCRIRAAQLAYANRNAPTNKTTTAKVEQGMTTEEFEERASKLLTERVPLPPVPAKILATKVEDMGFKTAQHAIACFSDYHFGSKVDPEVTGGIGGYDVATARYRLTDWRDGVLRFTQMMQTTLDVPVLHILALGDDMEGNGHMYGTQAMEMELSPYFQFLGFVADMTDVLVSLQSRFEKIHVYKVFGNHGRMSGSKKDAFDPDNIELMAWQTIAARCELAAPGKFTFDISPSFFQIVDILGYSFYLRHGDGVNLHATYTGVVENKLAMNSIVGQVLNYMVLGHHHTASEREEEIDGDVISNGCFVGPSLLALKMRRPRANRPSQEMFFVHPDKGITHRHRIHLASAEEVRDINIIKR
ncbi:hypothetical protein LCGC14_0288980 [marine sediment metagenome]|uniref:Calcineurin-like phosphoesterase domain-containing protein n=1 Tax=marine sediment metagenome TaxID=412755 RepID=A0A0F9WEY6_9ZZZZ